MSRCVASVHEACQGIDYEIIIVDNASDFETRDFLRSINEGHIKVIENDVNLGFGKAMNIGFDQCQGQYTLILNPDTVITQESIRRTIDHLSQHPKCGAVGVRLMDGQGQFLRESKRNFPSISRAIQKLIGLNVQSDYYAHHIEENESAEVDVLTGAFLMTRHNILNQLNGFDEQYFMYGEDIDLCRSVSELGYSCYYLGSVSIIHFKGESTDKRSVRYAKSFYSAMLIYFKKYHSQNKVLLAILSTSLIVMGMLQWGIANLKKPFLVVVRAVLYTTIFHLVSTFWAITHFGQSDYFDHSHHYNQILVYGVVFALVFSFSSKITRFRSYIMGAVILLMGYAMLPDYWRTSRFVLVVGSIVVGLSEVVYSLIRHRLMKGEWRLWQHSPTAILLANLEDTTDYISLIDQNEDYDLFGVVHTGDRLPKGAYHISDLDSILKNESIDILIIEQGSYSMKATTKLMADYGSRFRYFLYSMKEADMISSSDSNHPGIVSMIEAKWAIADEANRFYKRSTDFILAFLLLLLSPILVWMVGHKRNFLKNLLNVIRGSITYVGYNLSDMGLDLLPKLRPSILQLRASAQTSHDRNRHYARDYSIFKDLKEIFTRFSELGNSVQL